MSSTNYEVVLRDLREEETRLESELQNVRAAIPAIEVLARRTPVPFTAPIVFSPPPPPAIPSPTSQYAGLGAKAAILAYLRSVREPRFPAAIARDLVSGGLVTRSGDFGRMVTATLGQMKGDGLVESTPNGWVISSKHIDQEALDQQRTDVHR